MNSIRYQRRTLTPAFNHTYLKNLVPMFTECAGKVVKGMKDELAASGDPKKGLKTDVYSWMMRMTLDVIGLGGFGYNFEALGGSLQDKRMNKCRDAYDHVMSGIVKPQRLFIPY